MKQCRSSDRHRSEQLDSMLQDRPWHQVAEFASYSCQVATLGLKPWQPPPAHVNDPDHPEPGEETAAALLQRMLKVGVSRWHPTPLVALEAAERAT
jgi:hypothetical protein